MTRILRFAGCDRKEVSTVCALFSVCFGIEFRDTSEFQELYILYIIREPRRGGHGSRVAGGRRVGVVLERVSPRSSLISLCPCISPRLDVGHVHGVDHSDHRVHDAIKY